MSSQLPIHLPQLDPITAQELSLSAAKYFQPRAPISTRELFSGRWEQLTTVVDAISQTGLHIVIFGERGVGKSSLANIIDPLVYVMEEDIAGARVEPRLVVKVNINQNDSFSDAWRRVFEEIFWIEDRPITGVVAAPQNVPLTLKEAFNISDRPSIDIVRRTLAVLRRSVIIFDEFDRGSESLRTAFTDLIKALSDYAVDSTLVLVGVSDTIDHLIQGHASIVRSLVQIKLPRMEEKELNEILDKGAKALSVRFNQQASSLIVRMSQGLPHYTHLIGLHAVREAIGKALSRSVEITHVHDSFNKAVTQAVQGLQDQYFKAIHSAHKEALYEKVLLACAAASSCAKDAMGWFHPVDVVEPLATILNRPNVRIATFQKHLNELHEKERGEILERAGTPRAYKFRFREPLLPPFIFMTALANSLIDVHQLGMVTSL